MITEVHRWMTADGQLFEQIEQAEQHELKLNRHAHVVQLREMEHQQRADKRMLGSRWWQNDYVSRCKQSDLQRKIREQANVLRRMNKELANIT